MSTELAARRRQGLLRFDGSIAGIGTSSGVRIVLGLWDRSPLGMFADAMIELPDGTRVLVAPDNAVADFVAGTYCFDEVRVEPTVRTAGRSELRVRSPSLDVAVEFGERTRVGRLLRLVPAPLARSRKWCRLIDPVASRIRPGIRTHGTAGQNRHEYYCALDERAVVAVRGSWEGHDLGSLRDVEPPVRFGFGSAPRVPALVRVTTVIERRSTAG